MFPVDQLLYQSFPKLVMPFQILTFYVFYHVRFMMCQLIWMNTPVETMLSLLQLVHIPMHCSGNPIYHKCTIMATLKT